MAHCDEDEPRDDRHVLRGAEVDERDGKRQGDREHEQRRTEALQRRERGTDRQQLDHQEAWLPVVTARIFIEDSDPRLQRAHEDGEEDHRERRQEPCGNRAVCLVEREGECDRHGGRERAVADQGGVAMIVAEDREQRAGREEHDDPPM